MLKEKKELGYVKDLILKERMYLPKIGTRKLYFLLQDKIKASGIKIGRDALFTFLRRENMLVAPTKKYVKTTNSKHWLKKHPNLYSNARPTRPEEFFVSDITFIKSKEKTHYLSLVTDAFSRKIMGYELSNNMEAENIIKALEMAIGNRHTKNALIHHSDRGLQYASSLYQERLRKAGIKPSMTDGYDCYQNALAERINGILKQEFLINKYNNYKELKKVVKQSIELYNSKRPHLSLNMNTPDFIHKKSCKEFLTGL